MKAQGGGGMATRVCCAPEPFPGGQERLKRKNRIQTSKLGQNFLLGSISLMGCCRSHSEYGLLWRACDSSYRTPSKEEYYRNGEEQTHEYPTPALMRLRLCC